MRFADSAKSSWGSGERPARRQRRSLRRPARRLFPRFAPGFLRDIVSISNDINQLRRRFVSPVSFPTPRERAQPALFALGLHRRAKLRPRPQDKWEGQRCPRIVPKTETIGFPARLAALPHVMRLLQPIDRRRQALHAAPSIAATDIANNAGTGGDCRHGTIAPPAGSASTYCAIRLPRGRDPWCVLEPRPQHLPTLSATSCEMSFAAQPFIEP